MGVFPPFAAFFYWCNGFSPCWKKLLSISLYEKSKTLCSDYNIDSIDLQDLDLETKEILLVKARELEQPSFLFFINY